MKILLCPLETSPPHCEFCIWIRHGPDFPIRAFLVALLVKNLPATQETRLWSLGQEDPLEEGMATTPVFRLENPMDRGPWWAIVHGFSKSRTCLSDWHFHFSNLPIGRITCSSRKNNILPASTEQSLKITSLLGLVRGHRTHHDAAQTWICDLSITWHLMYSLLSQKPNLCPDF